MLAFTNLPNAYIIHHWQPFQIHGHSLYPNVFSCLFLLKQLYFEQIKAFCWLLTFCMDRYIFFLQAEPAISRIFQCSSGKYDRNHASA